MMISFPAVSIPWVITVFFVILGWRTMRPKGDFDFFSPILGLGMCIIGVLATWLIYFAVLYFIAT